MTASAELVCMSIGVILGAIVGLYAGLMLGTDGAAARLYRTCIEHHPVAECATLRPKGDAE